MKKPYSAPKLTGPFSSPALQKAAVDAAKCEARLEMVDLIITMAETHTEGNILSRAHNVELGRLVSQLMALQTSCEWEKRKAIDAFIELVQEQLRQETGQRI